MLQCLFEGRRRVNWDQWDGLMRAECATRPRATPFEHLFRVFYEHAMREGAGTRELQILITGKAMPVMMPSSYCGSDSISMAVASVLAIADCAREDLPNAKPLANIVFHLLCGLPMVIFKVDVHNSIACGYFKESDLRTSALRVPDSQLLNALL